MKVVKPNYMRTVGRIEDVWPVNGQYQIKKYFLKFVYLGDFPKQCSGDPGPPSSNFCPLGPMLARVQGCSAAQPCGTRDYSGQVLVLISWNLQGYWRVSCTGSPGNAQGLYNDGECNWVGYLQSKHLSPCTLSPIPGKAL